MTYKKILMCLTAIGLSACGATTPVREESQPSSIVSVTKNSEVSAQKSGSTITIRAIGDILLHDFVYETVRTENGFAFDSMLEPVKPYIENADITIANLETIAAGDTLPLSSYPLFNAPSEIIDTLKNVGVDIVNNTTNHTMDLGAEGAYASIQALKNREMLYVGSYESWDDYNTPRIIEKNGIKVGFLAYAYGTNGNYLPEDQTYLNTLIDTHLMPLEIEALNEQVDVSVVIIQNGEEYEPLPLHYQFEVHNVARDAGANFILGGHPHVLEPFIHYNEAQAGIFSHGNFLTGQYEVETKIGGITEVTYRKTANGVEVDSMRFMPTYNFGLPETTEYLVVPLADWEKYGIPNGEALYEQIEARMTYYTNKVQVVPYLD
ncbi:MAG: CapA family protein [Aerococcaceae bacterium]|nr:CapA family protein [Aerococcaceae bacterium]